MNYSTGQKARALRTSRALRRQPRGEIQVLKDFFNEVEEMEELTLSQLGADSGLGSVNVFRYRSGRVVPGLDKVVAMANAVGYEVTISKRKK